MMPMLVLHGLEANGKKRSLLTGIQPASDNHRLSLSSLAGTSSPSSPEFTRWIAEEVERAHDTNIESVNTACDPNTPFSTPPVSPLRSQRSQGVAATPSPTSARPHKPKRHSKTNRTSFPIADSVPNFRHFPAEDTSPRSFSRNPARSTSAEPLSPTLSVSLEEVSTHFNPRRPPPLPVVSQDAFTATSPSLLPETAPPEIPPAIPPPPDPELLFNPAELGLVHLAPVDTYKLASSGSATSSGHYYTPESSVIAAPFSSPTDSATADHEEGDMDFRTAPGSPSNSGSGSLPESRSETSDGLYWIDIGRRLRSRQVLRWAIVPLVVAHIHEHNGTNGEAN